MRGDVAAALPAWILARVIVLAALGVAHLVIRAEHSPRAATVFRVHQGLFAWDGAFYREIAAHGYAAVRFQGGLRFYPLVPLLARALSVGAGNRIAAGVALLVVGNAAALGAGALLHRVALVETGDAELARRAAWLGMLAPPAAVLVLAYAESTAILLAIATFLLLRRGRWVWAAAAGMLAGLTRPVGVLLVVPAVIEAGPGLVSAAGRVHLAGMLHLGHRARRSRRQVAARLAAIVAPAAGTALYLAWAGLAYGDAWAPVRAQEDRRQRGHLTNPITALLHESRGLIHGRHLGSALHVFWAVGLVVLLIVCVRRWPRSYAAFAGAMLLVALTSANLDSLERYALSAFPFVLAAASLTADSRVERALLVLSSVAMAGYALLDFLNISIP